MTRKEILAAIGEIAREHLGQEGPLAQDTRLVEDLRAASDRRLVLRSPFETDSLKKVNDEIAEAARLVSELRAQIERNPDANEGFLDKLEEDARKATKRLEDLKVKAVAVQTELFLKEREKLDTRFDNRQSRFEDIRAIGPDREVRLAEQALQRHLANKANIYIIILSKKYVLFFLNELKKTK